MVEQRTSDDAADKSREPQRPEEHPEVRKRRPYVDPAAEAWSRNPNPSPPIHPHA